MKVTILAYALAISSCLAEVRQGDRQGKTKTYLVEYKKNTLAEKSLKSLEMKGALSISSSFESISTYRIKMTAEQALEVASGSDIKAVEVENLDFRIMGWTDPVQPEDTQDGQRKLSEEIPYGIPMVRAGPGDGENEYLTSTNIVSPKKVCVIDSGYDNNHEDLPSADGVSTFGSAGSWSTDGCDHGTHCAGSIGAIGNTKGVVGVIGDPTKLDFFIVRVFNDDCYWASTAGLISAVEKCIDADADIVSMSLGGSFNSQIEADAFKKHYNDDNVLFIAAAGNGGNNAMLYPASHPAVMSVAAVDSGEVKASFSQFNSQVEISAPGVSIKSTVSGGYGYKSGTSMATPHVAGVAALVWGNHPECTNNQIRHALVKSARPKGANGCDNNYGFGIVDAWKAHELILEKGCDGVETTGEMLGGCAFVEGGIGDGSPTIAPTPAATISCPESESAVTFELKTDKYVPESAWSLKNSAGVKVLDRLSSNYANANTEYSEDYCLFSGDYVFEITDSYGDGICCTYGNGYYKMYEGSTLLFEGGTFTSSASETFTVGETSVTCKSWCNQINIPFNSPNGSVAKCDFIGHCHTCAECSS